MSKTIAIIGGSGFIGSNLANFFFENGYDVLVIGRTFDENKFKSKKIKKIELDVNFTSQLVQHLLGRETIIWLVNNLVPSTNMDSLIDDFTFNVTPLIKTLESINSLQNLKRFVFISSGGTIYGDSFDRVALSEDSVKAPISAYGLSKIISENFVDFLTKKSKFQSFILRPSNVYGIHQNIKKPQGIIGYAFNSILTNSSIDLYNNGFVTRDFIFVDDLAEAINCCINSEYQCGTIKTYNVGSQIGYTINDVLGMINQISNIEITTISKSARTFDCNYNVLNIDKIERELKWKPKVSLKEGLTFVWDWVKNHESKN